MLNVLAWLVGHTCVLTSMKALLSCSSGDNANTDVMLESHWVP